MRKFYWFSMFMSWVFIRITFLPLKIDPLSLVEQLSDELVEG